MLEQIFGELSLRQVLVALSILVIFCGLAWLFRLFLVRIARRLAQKTKTHLDDAILSVLQKPLTAIVILAGLYLAVLTLPEEIAAWSYTAKGLATVLSLVGIFTVVVLLDTVMKWYRREVTAKKKDVGFSIRLISLSWVAMIVIAIWLAVIASLSIWGLEVTPVTSWLGEHGWRIALIVILAVLAVVSMGEIVPRVIVRTLTRRPDETEDEVKKRSDTLSRVLVGTIQVFIFFIAIFMILSELQIDIAPILAGAGVVGIAIGFGAQSLVKDLVAGLFIIIENHYRVGDVVKIADVAGIVEGINLRRTVLRDLDGIVHVVPNGEIRVASNFTKDWSRVNLNISVAYGENLDHVISVINRVGQELTEDPEWAPIILKAPQVLRVDNLGESGVEIKILGDTKPIRQWDVMGELRRRLKNAFDEEGIEIPWPHTKVYFGNTPTYAGAGQDFMKKG
jgi:small conductance mechanosensitive channel